MINGIIFSKMINGALGMLALYEREIDDLNVFPVPDGDTGANMRRTVELGVQSAPQTENLCQYIEKLSTGMLFGARGNSGVILSQIFKGISAALLGKESCTAEDMLNALSLGYTTAYNTVYAPVEGTILTVLREGVARAKEANCKDVDTMLQTLLAEMEKVLKTTPDLLPVLKEAGVVDSGGYGLVKIVEGMLTAYRGEEVGYKSAVQTDKEIDFSAFNQHTVFSFGYCMEFILQLQAQKIDVDGFSKQDYTQEISAHGNSIVVIQDGSRVRVHIHTFTPEEVMSLSRKYGEFVFFKMDNMALQHNEKIANKASKTTPHKDMEIISVAPGSSIAALFTDLGSGITVNTAGSVSVQDLIDALNCANADTVLILPNDKNAVQTANQAVKMYKNDSVRVEVIPTRSVAEGYFALASDMPDLSVEERISAIKDGAECVSTVSISKCVQNRTCGGITCAVGDFASFANGKLVSSNRDILRGVEAAFGALDGIEDKETALVFVGKVDSIEEITERLENLYPSLQINFIDGAFTEEKLIIGLV